MYVTLNISDPLRDVMYNTYICISQVYYFVPFQGTGAGCNLKTVRDEESVTRARMLRSIPNKKDESPETDL